MYIHNNSPDLYVFVSVSQPTKPRAEFVTTRSGMRAYARWRRKGRIYIYIYTYIYIYIHIYIYIYFYIYTYIYISG